MNNQVETPDRMHELERPTILENVDDRLSIGSVFDEEKRLLDSTSKRFVTYFTVFALTEYFLLFTFQRYFYLRKAASNREFADSPFVIMDFEISKYFFYRACSILLIVLNKKTGVDHIKLILKEFRTNQSFLIFVVVDVVLIFCLIVLVETHSIATVLLVVHPKIVYNIASKGLKRYHLRNAEMFLLFAFSVFVVSVYFFAAQMHYFSIIAILVSGVLFYAGEELINSHINLQEWEVLRYVSVLFISILFLTKELFEGSQGVFGFEMWDVVVWILIVLLDYTKSFVIKRIHVFNRENTSRTYFPLMLVFVGLFGLIFDLILNNHFLSVGEFVGGLFFVGTLIVYYRFDLSRLFWPRTVVQDLDASEELLIHK